jgi:hypothetical protein
MMPSFTRSMGPTRALVTADYSGPASVMGALDLVSGALDALEALLGAW